MSDFIITFKEMYPEHIDLLKPENELELVEFFTQLHKESFLTIEDINKDLFKKDPVDVKQRLSKSNHTYELITQWLEYENSL